MTELKMIENLEHFLDKLSTEEVKVEVIKRYVRHLKMEQRVISQGQEKKANRDFKREYDLAIAANKQLAEAAANLATENAALREKGGDIKAFLEKLKSAQKETE